MDLFLDNPDVDHPDDPVPFPFPTHNVEPAPEITTQVNQLHSDVSKLLLTPVPKKTASQPIKIIRSTDKVAQLSTKQVFVKMTEVFTTEYMPNNLYSMLPQQFVNGMDIRAFIAKYSKKNKNGKIQLRDLEIPNKLHQQGLLNLFDRLDRTNTNAWLRQLILNSIDK